MEVAPTHKLLTLLYSIISIAIWQERHNYMALWALEQKEGRVEGIDWILFQQLWPGPLGHPRC